MRSGRERLSGSPRSGGRGLEPSRGLLGVTLVLSCVACCACGDEQAPPPSTIERGAETNDAGAGTGDRGGAGGASGGGPERDGGDSSFGFDEFAVDENPPAPGGAVDGGEAALPDGWRCRAELGRDAVCDCGCGAPDQACATLGCGTPGCSLPVCQACFGDDGAARDCGAPGAWSCERSRRGDGVCDCGCGALDPDCEAGAGCHPYGCNVPGCVLCQGPDGAVPCGAPAAFTCGEASKNDGQCDCGCGNYDPECAHSSCVEPGCYASGCASCHDAAGKSATCDAPNTGWRCAPEQRNDGACDCGCGQEDPDCAGDGCAAPGCSASACTTCHDAFGRALPCPGEWTCAPSRFADGLACDCGCGRADPDCGQDGCGELGCQASGCDVRWGEGGAPIRPERWSCAPADFGGGDGCDCGCGALDPDCSGGCAEPGCRAPGCGQCRAADGAAFECRWSCAPERYGSGEACDCGCGQDDPDCAGDLGCSTPGCAANGCASCFGGDGAELSCERGACPADFQNDGVCDCGCREDDPDCIATRDCVEPGCSADGCGRCHGAAGEVLTCAHWSCGELERQGGDDGCNCGCGAPDPDCNAGDGCALPGCAGEGCDTCRSPDGAPMSCPP